MVTKNNLVFLFHNNGIHRFDKYRYIVLIGLFFSIVITTVNSSGNGVFFFLVHATPAGQGGPSGKPGPAQSLGNKTIVPLGDGFLNVITKMKNLYTLEGRSFNGTRTTPEFGLAAGSLTPKDFTLRVLNDNPRPESFPGKSLDTTGKGQVVKLSSGFYRVDLESPWGSAYVTEMSPDCKGTIKVKEVKECIVTHTFVGTALLKVITTVDNTGGGTAKPEDFTILVRESNTPGGSGGSTPREVTGTPYPGKEVTIFPFPFGPESGWFGHYADLLPLPGYIIRADDDCTPYKTYDLIAGETKECTFTYKFVGKATVKVITTVDNTGGGTAKAEYFSFKIENNGVRFGELPGDPLGKDVQLSAGAYRVTGDREGDYSHIESSGCWGVISPGESKECRITNTFKGP